MTKLSKFNTVFSLLFVLFPLFLLSNLALSSTDELNSTVTIGMGADQVRHPFGDVYKNYRTAGIYMAAEIGRAGTITNLRWYPAQAYAMNQASRHLLIYLKHVAYNEIPVMPVYNDLVAGATLVYVDANYSGVGIGMAWQDFAIAPFDYNGVDNLMVFTVIDVSAAGASDLGGQYRNTPSALARFFMTEKNTEASANTLVGQRRFYAPNIQIVMNDILPVTLASFSAVTGNSEVTLQWRVESEVNNRQFNLYRSTDPSAVGNVLTVVPGRGTVATPMDYSFTDTRVENGATYYYRLSDVSLDGIEQIHPNVVMATPTAEQIAVIPGKYALKQNFPNPFNHSTEISYAVARAGNVRIALYDLQGREIRTIVNSFHQANHYRVTLDANGLAAGVYMYRMDANGFSTAKKLIYLK